MTLHLRRLTDSIEGFQNLVCVDLSATAPHQRRRGTGDGLCCRRRLDQSSGIEPKGAGEARLLAHVHVCVH